MTQISKAMVLAAGLGLRMRPLTDDKPKPLVPVAGKPLIDHTLDWLAASGVTEAVVNSHYKAEMLEAHLAARRMPRVRISHEDVLLETGGGIKKALPLLGDSAFFIGNSDVICIDGSTPALQRLAIRWDDNGMDALLLVHPVAKAIGYAGPGDFFVSDKGHIRRRGEKEQAPFVFTGIQILHPRLFADSPQGAFSLNLLYDRAIGDGTAPRIFALPHDGNWLHVGDPQGLRQAEAWLQKRAL